MKEAAIAVNVLSHEAWHLAGVRDEAATQCYALQTNADTAARLGASREDAAAIAVFIVREVQPVLPADYRSSGLLRRRPARPAARTRLLALGQPSAKVAISASATTRIGRPDT